MKGASTVRAQSRPRVEKYFPRDHREANQLPQCVGATQTSNRTGSWNPPRRLCVIVLVFLFLSVRRYGASYWGLRPYHAPSGTGNPAYLIRARNGAVASENGRCSAVGVEVLKDGGNAVDAAIAVSLCIGVVNMFSSGIGGGGFITVRIPPSPTGGTSHVYTVDFREVAPALANATMFVNRPEAAMYGGLSVGVPSELRGLEEAHRRWGKLSWRKIVQPSVSLACGWTVDRELAKRIPWYSSLMLEDPNWSSIFAPHGVLLREGELIRRTNYSRTLAAVATGGADALYTGTIADAIVRKVQLAGGILTHNDLANYTVNVQRALQGSYRGRKVYTTNAPGSGLVLLHMLNLVENFDFSKGRTELNVHRLLEALKFGFAARTKVGDPAYHDNAKSMDVIHTKSYARLIWPNITNSTHTAKYYKPEYDVPLDYGTSHISVVDKDGMAVALTSTINSVFGSQVLDPDTGIIFNNQMAGFPTPAPRNGVGLLPSRYNYPDGGKRPLSSTVPTIIENGDGSLHLVIGGAGGTRIFGAVFQVLLNLEWGADVSAAIEHGRLHDQLFPQFVDADSTYPPALLDALCQRGHNVTVHDIRDVAAVVQVVQVSGGEIFAASDSRKNGIAAGY